jgi:hypothetical protein
MTRVTTLDATALLPERVRPLRRGEYERMVAFPDIGVNVGDLFGTIEPKILSLTIRL